MGDDGGKRVNVNMDKKLVERIDKYAQEKNVSRSLLVSEAMTKVLNDRVATARFVETVGPGIERHLSEDDETWIEDKIEQIMKNQRNPDLQDIHAADLVEYIKPIDDWYTHTGLQSFILRSFREPFSEKVQAKMVRMVDLAFLFSDTCGDERNWGIWHDETLDHLKNVILRREGKWDSSLRARLFYDVFGMRMLLRSDDRPVPQELLDFLVEGVESFSQEERREYDLAHLIAAVAERSKDDGKRLKDKLLRLCKSKTTTEDVGQYILSLLKMEQFRGM